MNIRVIGGRYGGRRLVTPSGDKTHPMGERIRNALFNSIGSDIVGKTVLDAFAGTGAVGIEALSRGAAQALFIEKDKTAQECIWQNMESLGIIDGSLVRATVRSWLDTYHGASFDIIFADPPYHDTQRATLQALLQLLKPSGTLVLSWPETQPAPVFNGADIYFERAYAGARIIMYKMQ